MLSAGLGSRAGADEEFALTDPFANPLRAIKNHTHLATDFLLM